MNKITEIFEKIKGWGHALYVACPSKIFFAHFLSSIFQLLMLQYGHVGGTLF